MFGTPLVDKHGGGKLWALMLKGRLDNVLAAPDQPALGGWLATMKPFAGEKIITYHRSWTYFASRFDLTVAGELEPSRHSTKPRACDRDHPDSTGCGREGARDGTVLQPEGTGPARGPDGHIGYRVYAFCRRPA